LDEIDGGVVMNVSRCPWVDVTKPDYVKYHDEEWGVPIYDDKTLFEFVVLESAQAGLSWYTILRRRDEYRKAFAQYDIKTVAQFNEDDIETLVNDVGIIRHRGKIKAAIGNANVILALQQEFGSFSHYLWAYVNHKPMVKRPQSIDDYATTSALSEKISIDLKKRGFKFFGSTICYSYLQACGLINEHSYDCFLSKSR